MKILLQNSSDISKEKYTKDSIELIFLYDHDLI